MEHNQAEVMESDLKAQLLRELEAHPAWKLYQAHLQELCKRKQVEVSLALRANRHFEASKAQFETDGIILALTSLNKLLAHSETGEEPE